MDEIKNVTAQNLKLVRVQRNLGQGDIAEVLGLTSNQISKIESGGRALSEPEQKLLNWYFFGILPKRITDFPADLRGILQFDEGEWGIVTMLAARDGFDNPREWIGKKIKDYLAVFDAIKQPVQGTLFNDGAGNKTSYRDLKALPPAKVAEEAAPKTGA